MTKDDKIEVYCSGSLKRDIAEIAQAHGEDVSPYVRQILKNHIAQQHKEDIERKARAEDRIEAAASLGRDQIQQEIKTFDERAQDMQILAAKAGAYAVAAFRLQAENTGDTYAREALQSGRKAMRENLLADLPVAADELDLPGIDEAAEAETAAEGDEASTVMPWEKNGNNE